MTASAFSERLLHWFDRHGRHDLPWQSPRSAYRVWLSEVMLQQTQVATVIPYFERFVARFPDFATLAAAPIDDVLALWAGLGYYARGRNLHAAAKQIVAVHGGEMPRDFEAVQALPGIGRSTAAAILSQAYGERHAILDGNVKRVLARHEAVPGWPGDNAVARRLWLAAEQRLPQARLADYTQAIMDLGATVCRSRVPACTRCPVAEDCKALQSGRVGDFPSPRPARERPVRESLLLLIEDEQGRNLFERRPPAGIWGGLWCLPVAEITGSIDAVLRERYGLQSLSKAVPMPTFRHAFTHFELRLSPMRIRVSSLTAAHASAEVREQDGQRWINIRQALPAGLPAPVLQFLTHLLEQHKPPCPEPSIASSSAPMPKASTARQSRGSSANASSSTFPSKPGKTGSRTRPV